MAGHLRLHAFSRRNSERRSTLRARDNRHTVHRIVEELWQSRARNQRVVDEVFALDYVNHDLSIPSVRGLEQFKGWAVGLRASWESGFPDYRITIEDLIADEDRVAIRWTFRGTHTGEFMGIAPTRRQVTMRAIAIYCFCGGKVTDIWWNYDSAGLIQQLAAG